MEKPKPHVADYKKKVVENITNLISQYPIVGAVNMENLPATQLQQMRAQLRGKVVITMTKRRIMKIAIEQAKLKKKGIEKLEPYLKGMPALIFTKENPFALFKTLKKNKSPAPAKAGQTAPKDIIVNKGSTSFAPGPVIGELAQAGIKAGVEGGKVAIREDSVVVKEGEKIKPNIAAILTRLGIEPMEVGLDLTAVYENGVIYEKKVLDIDEDKFNADLQSAASYAVNLSVFAAYPTKETIELMLSQAFGDAKALGLSQRIIDDEIIDELLGMAEQSMLSLKSAANIQVSEKAMGKEAKEEKKGKPKETETKQAEIKKEEKKIIAKEEEVLEAEKETIEEEKALGKKESKIEAPVEKEARKIVKEEEEKILEGKRIEEEKEFEKLEKEKKEVEEKISHEEIKEEEKEKTENKVAHIVEKMQMHAAGKEPSAEDMVKEAEKEEIKPRAKEQKERTAEDMINILSKKGTLRGVEKEPLKPLKTEKIREDEEIKALKKEKDQKSVENLAQQLMRKGTLRK